MWPIWFWRTVNLAAWHLEQGRGASEVEALLIGRNPNRDRELLGQAVEFAQQGLEWGRAINDLPANSPLSDATGGITPPFADVTLRARVTMEGPAGATRTTVVTVTVPWNMTPEEVEDVINGVMEQQRSNYPGWSLSEFTVVGSAIADLR